MQPLFESESPSTQYYRKPLPSTCIDFASEKGKTIFAEALRNGHMNCFFKICSQFRTQDEPAYCGLTSLVIALNVLEIDPGRIWKGPWRWYHENMLDCCTPLQVAREKGINMDQFVCLAHCNNLIAKVKRGSDITSVDELRDEIKMATARDDVVFVASYSRKTLGQTGDGHFSPVAGYHEQQDLVLILDTARFKYSPHWVSLQILLDAMKTQDSETGKSRGFVLLSRDEGQPGLLFFRPSCTLTVERERGKLSCQMLNFMGEWEKWLSSTIKVPCRGKDVIHYALSHMMQMRSSGKQFVSLFCFSLPVAKDCQNKCTTESSHPFTRAVRQLISELESLEVFRTVQECFRRKTDAEKGIFLELFQICMPGEKSCRKVSKFSEMSTCVGISKIGPEHAVALFLLSWPHTSPVIGDITKSISASKSVHIQESKNQPSSEDTCRAGELLADFVSTDLNKDDHPCISGEINTMKFKIEEVIKYHCHSAASDTAASSHLILT